VANPKSGDIRVNRVKHPQGLRANTVYVLTWNAEDDQLLKTDIPLWMMRFSSINILSHLGIAPNRYRLTAEDVASFRPRHRGGLQRAGLEARADLGGVDTSGRYELDRRCATSPGIVSGGSVASIARRDRSSHGGSISRSPRREYGSSVAKPGGVRGDFEQDAAGLAVVDRVKVPAVHHRRHVDAGPHQHVPPFALILVVGRAPCR
jgi:hypothetical protein